MVTRVINDGIPFESPKNFDNLKNSTYMNNKGLTLVAEIVNKTAKFVVVKTTENVTENQGKTIVPIVLRYGIQWHT